MLAINSKQKSNFLRNTALGRIIDRSLFAKFFLACASIIVVSFFVFGIVMIIFSIRYSNSEKEKLYLNNARKISESFSSVTSEEDEQILLSMLQMTAYNLDANIYICFSDGRIWRTVNPYIVAGSDNKISKSIMSQINNRHEIIEEGTLGGFFDTTYTTGGVPIYTRDHSNVVGAVFVCSKGGNLTKTISDIFKIFILSLMMTLLLSFIAIYFVTARLIKPLRQMNSAAASFSKGDFSARIPVSSSDEIGQLSASFNNMAQSLASLEEMRSSFVGNVSHELKTPMTSISGFIDGILDGTIPPEKHNYYLKIVSDEVKRLSRLVRSFLDIARIEAGELKINPTEFDIVELTRRVIIGFEQQIDKKSLEIRGLDFDNQIMVYADFDLTYQIVYNLIDNAVKFSNEGGYIEINIAKEKKKVYVGIKNSGMGIPSAELPYVFDRFYKTDKSRSRDRKGVGLGLYIVKSVLNKQGEDIVVRSVEGQYCEFVFTLKDASKITN